MINARLADEEKDIMLVTRKGMSIRFSEADVRSTGRASIGVRGILLREGDSVIGMDICDPDNSLLIITEKGFGKRTDIGEYRIQSRGGKGLLTYKISDKTGELTGMMMVNDLNDVMLITSEGVIIRIHAADINTIGRNTSGVRLMRTAENNLIVSCAKTDREEDEPEEGAAMEDPQVPEDGTDPEPFEEEDDAADEAGPDTDAGKDILDKLDIE